MRKFSIVTRLSFLVAFIVMIALATNNFLGLSATNNSNEKIRKLVKADVSESESQLLSFAVSSIGMQVKAFFEVSLDATRTLAELLAGEADKPETERVLDRHGIVTVLGDVLKKNPNWTYIYTEWEPDILGQDADYIQDKNIGVNGRFIPVISNSNGKINVKPDGEFSEDVVWYKCPTETKRDCITDPIVYEYQGKDELFVEVTSPVLRGSDAVGMVGVSLPAGAVDGMLNDALLSIEGAIAVIYTDQGTIVASNKYKKLVGEKIQELPDYLRRQIRSGLSSLDGQVVQDDRYVYSGQKIQFGNMKAQWHVMVAVPQEIVFASIHKIEQFMISVADDIGQTVLISSLVMMAVVFALLFFVIRYQLSPLNVVNKAIREIASGGGDLTQRLDEKGNDEVTEINQSVNKLLVQLQGMIREMAGSEKELSVSSNSASISINEVNESIARNMDLLNQQVAAAEEMAASSSQVASNADESNNANSQVLEQVHRCISIIKDNVQRSQIASEELEKAASKVDQLKSSGASIAGLLDEINGIAEQTNLLALNAAIESARAGEAGRGFAVVADEVRNLARKSQNSVENIAKTLNQFSENIDQVTHVILAGREGAIDGYNASVEVESAMNLVTGKIQELSDYNTQTASAAEQQSSVSQEISSSITDLHGYLKDSMKLSRQALHHNEKLNENAATIRNRISKFKA